MTTLAPIAKFTASYPDAEVLWIADGLAMGEARAIAAINHSIANGWQGIFEPKSPVVASPPVEGGITMVAGRAMKQ